MDRFSAKLSALTWLSCLLLGWAGMASGQTTLDPAREKRRVSDERRKAREGQGVVTESQYLTRLLGRTVTYDEVLKNPDDVDLNLAFARTQIRNGDLNGAASTLERVLLIRPDNLTVRILYAIVLFRLDARNDAEREIRNILKQKIDPSVRTELTLYLKEIAWRNKRTRVLVLLHTSYQFESNRNTVPAGRTLNSPGGVIVLNGENQALPDSAFRGLARVTVSHKIGGARGHRAIGSVGFYHSEQLRLDQLTVSAADAEGGVLLDLTPVQLQIMGFVQYLRLSHEPFLTNGGARIQADWWLNRSTSLRGTAIFDSQHFRELTETTDQKRRTGPQISGTASVRHTFDAQNFGAAGLLLLRKTANVNYWRYYGIGLFFQHRYAFGHGMYLQSGLSWSYNIHDGPNLIESSRTRYQHFVEVGTTFGVPFSTMFRSVKLPELVRLVNLSVGVTYERSLSNIRNYRYQNWRINVGLTRQFVF